MILELSRLLSAAGWYLGFPSPEDEQVSGLTPWWVCFPLERGDAVSATDLTNLLRLGGYDARPNKKNPTRVYVKVT
jgi:hypothetical protein